MCYYVHMETINIRSLHIKTGEIVRRVHEGHRLVITDHGKPVAALVPFREDEFGIGFEARETLPDFDGLPPVSRDSSSYISDDRNDSDDRNGSDDRGRG